MIIRMCLVFAVFAQGALAQEDLEATLSDLRAIHDDQNASRADLKRAVDLIDTIVDNHPSSDAAVSILLGESYEGVDFSSFAARLEQLAARVAGLPTFMPASPAGEDLIDPDASCLTENFAPNSQTEMQLEVVLTAEGRLQGLPALRAPIEPSRAVRGDYLGLVGAIEGCTPLGWGNPGAYTLSVAASGTISVAGDGAQVVGLAPAPEQRSVTSALPTFQVAPSDPAPGAQPEQEAPLSGAIPSFLTPTAPAAPVVISASSPETEDILQLDRQGVRDVQARLLVSGFDPNGVDGAMGRGTRGAVELWQGSVGAPATGYLSAQQLDILRKNSQAQLEAWLQDPVNASAYKPPVTAAKKQRKKRRVRACKRNVLGILYDCRYVWR